MRKDLQKFYHALLKGVVTVKVKFEVGGRLYTYRALESDNLRVGDTVVIQYRGKFFTTEVMEVDLYPDFSKDVEYKWIVCKVDAERYENFLHQEAMFEQQMLALSATKETNAVRKELIEQFGEENIGYLAAIAEGKVQTPTLADILDIITGRTFIENAHIEQEAIQSNNITITGNCNADRLAEAMRKAAVEGAHHGFEMLVSKSNTSQRIDWESRYNKHIAAMRTLGGTTWRDFMLPDQSVEDMAAVKNAKMLFDRYKRKQYTMEKFIEEFKDKL